MEINGHRLGLTLGVFLGLLHLVWGLSVGMGRAQDMMNWALNMHFLSNPYTVQPFSLGGTIVLIVLACIGGYIGGWVLSILWEWTDRFSA